MSGEAGGGLRFPRPGGAAPSASGRVVVGHRRRLVQRVLLALEPALEVVLVRGRLPPLVGHFDHFAEDIVLERNRPPVRVRDVTKLSQRYELHESRHEQQDDSAKRRKQNDKLHVPFFSQSAPANSQDHDELVRNSYFRLFLIKVEM